MRVVFSFNLGIVFPVRHLTTFLLAVLTIQIAALGSALANIELFSNQPELTADEPITFDQSTRSLVARGHAQLADKRFTMDAAEIRFEELEHRATATGDVKVSAPQIRLLSNQLSYDLYTMDMASTAFRAGSWPLFFEGESLEGSPDKMIASRSVAYIAQPDYLSPNIKAYKFTYIPQQKRIIVERAWVRIGQVPVFYMPYFTMTSFQPPIMFAGEIGHRNNLGYFARTTTLVPAGPIGDHLKLGALLDYYTERGLLYGPAANYNYKNNATDFSGYLRSAYIHDRGSPQDLGTDILGNPVTSNRDFIEWRHSQTIQDTIDITGVLSWWSDSEVTRDFRPNYFINNQTPDNFLQAVYRGEKTYTGIFTRFNPNDFEQVNQRLPEASFSLTPDPIFNTGILQQFDGSITSLSQKPLDGSPKLSTDRIDGSYQLSRPFVLASWVTFTPFATGRFTQYANIQGTGNEQDRYTRLLGQVGFDVDFKGWGQWNYTNKIWKIEGLRHVSRPVVQYRYLPNGDDGQGVIPLIDENVFATYVPTIDLNTFRHTDQINSMNLMRFGWLNRLQTKDGATARDLTHINFYQDLRFYTPEDEETWSTLFTELAVYPVRWLTLGVNNRFDFEHMTNNELQCYIGLIDGELWSARLSTEYLRGSPLQNALKQHLLEVGFQINERNHVYARWRYDQKLSEFTEQSYSYRTRLGNAWSAEFQVVFHKGSSRENGTQFNFMLALLEFPILNG